LAERIVDLGFLSELKTQKERITSKDLVAAVSHAIDKGLLQPGDRIPSMRELSLFLNIAKTTVARSFDQLIATGQLTATKGSGTFVAGGSCERMATNPGKTNSAEHSMQFEWETHFSQTAQRLLKQSPEFITSGDIDTINFGSTPAEFLPIGEWKSRIIAQYRADEIVPGGNKTEPLGFRPLRDALVGFLRRTKGIQCEATQIALYSSSQNALNHVLTLLSKPGQKALCENPGFAGAREHFRIHGIETVDAPIDSNGMIISSEKLEEADADWIYTTPACQDPTGAVLSQERRDVLMRWCNKHEVAIIEDGWDSDFHYGTKTSPTLYAQDKTGSVLYLYTFWRLLYPLTSTTLLVLPPALVDVFHRSKRLSDPPFATADDVVLCELLENGALEKHIRQVWKEYRKRRQAVIFELTKQFGSTISVMPYTGGMHAIVRFNRGWSTDKIMQAAKTCGLPIASTASYYAKNAAAQEYLIFFASINDADAEAVIERFSNAVKAGPDAI
jgi:GntR family transcriptional regulator/MocR family aminotransferase